MIGARSGFLIVLVAAVLAAPGNVLAKPPAHIDGIWNWRHHEPSPSQFRRAQHAKPFPRLPWRPATTAEVETLYHHLMRREGMQARRRR